MFDPLNKTVPPGIFSGSSGNDVRPVKSYIEGIHAELIYESNLPSYQNRSYPPFMTPAQQQYMPQLYTTNMTEKTILVEMLPSALKTSIENLDAKLNTFTYPPSIVGADNTAMFPPGPQTMHGVADLARSDLRKLPPWENPEIVPPCEGGGGSERPETGLLYPRKV